MVHWICSFPVHSKGSSNLCTPPPLETSPRKETSVYLHVNATTTFVIGILCAACKVGSGGYSRSPNIESWWIPKVCLLPLFNVLYTHILRVRLGIPIALTATYVVS